MMKNQLFWQIYICKYVCRYSEGEHYSILSISLVQAVWYGGGGGEKKYRHPKIDINYRTFKRLTIVIIKQMFSMYKSLASIKKKMFSTLLNSQ